MTEKTYARLNEIKDFLPFSILLNIHLKETILSSKTLFVTIKADTPQDVKKVIH